MPRSLQPPAQLLAVMSRTSVPEQAHPLALEVVLEVFAGTWLCLHDAGGSLEAIRSPKGQHDRCARH